MARLKIVVTGAADGLGAMTARLLVEQGHAVTLHARNEARCRDALAAAPGADAALPADLSSQAQIRRLAAALRAAGPWDAVIHNAAIGFREKRRVETEDGLSHVFAVNTVAPYLLTALVPAARHVFVSSELHRRGDPALHDLDWQSRPWRGNQAYSDTKLHVALLAAAVARHFPGTVGTALEPGWVATKMGGPRATGDLAQAHLTQAWLATGDDPLATTPGGYFFHCRPKKAHGAVGGVAAQEKLLAACADRTGTSWPDIRETA